MINYKLFVLFLVFIISCNTDTTIEVDEIIFSNFYCEGECPVYKLEIKLDGQVVYHAIDYNKEANGIYIGYLDNNIKKRIKAYIKNTKFRKIKENYKETKYLDDPCVSIMFLFKTNVVKEILDCSVSYEVEQLIEFYSIINFIKDNTSWNRIGNLEN